MTKSVEGKHSPVFNLPFTGGESLKSEDLKGEKYILFFYPKDNTPGWQAEASEFRDGYEDFRSMGYEVYGISKDGMKSHRSFKEKNQLPFELISDKEKVLHEAYGVLKEKNMFGKKVMGTERSTFIIDEEGIIAKEFRGVKSKGHVRDVLEYLKG